MLSILLYVLVSVDLFQDGNLVNNLKGFIDGSNVTIGQLVDLDGFRADSVF